MTCCFLTISCSENDEVENFQPQTYDVHGKVEKGPFVSGSTITLQPMNAKMQASGETYTSTIEDNVGNFTFGSKFLDAPFAELTANGYFFNEVGGTLSSGVLNLRSVVDLYDKSTINVNILTHLKSQRILNLVAKGSKFKDANAQAQKELFAAFGLSTYSQTDASLFSIAGGNDEAAALIAVSSLLLVDRNEAAFTEYLAKLCQEFGQNGQFSAATKEQIKKDRGELAGRLADIRNNIVNRYAELGLSVEVKELARFFDWDDNGVAGDETLQEGEKVIMETNRIEVPGEGGSYQIKITSPIPLFLEPGGDENDGFVSNTAPDPLFKELYKDIQNQDISVKKQLKDNVLTIDVAPLESRTEKAMAISIYDCLGTVLGTIDLVQAGNKDASLPSLGKSAERYMNEMKEVFANGFSEYCLLEQYYHYNKQINSVEKYISPYCTPISNCWAEFYRFNRNNLTFKHADVQQFGVWQELFNVFSAMQYYYMITAWGGVPYIKNYEWYGSNEWNIPRTNAENILHDLQGSLQQAIPMLDDKKNESLKDNNGLFFMSKDVAKFLLADIYMYQHDYSQAIVLLHDIIKNGFYELDDSKFSEKESLEKIRNNKGGKEILFALYAKGRTIATSSGVTLQIPPVIPLQTYTDVILSYAECLYKQGNEAEAKKQLNSVAEAKNISVSDDVWNGIIDARKQLLLYSNSNFAFMKRNGIAKEEYGIQNYRLLWPIPESEVFTNSNMTQNQGY